MSETSHVSKDRNCENNLALLFAIVGFLGGAAGIAAVSAPAAVALAFAFSLIGMFGGLVLGHYLCSLLKSKHAGPQPPAPRPVGATAPMRPAPAPQGPARTG